MVVRSLAGFGDPFEGPDINPSTGETIVDTGTGAASSALSSSPGSWSDTLQSVVKGLFGGASTVRYSASGAPLPSSSGPSTALVLGGIGVLVVGGILLLRRRA